MTCWLKTAVHNNARLYVVACVWFWQSDVSDDDFRALLIASCRFAPGSRFCDQIEWLLMIKATNISSVKSERININRTLISRGWFNREESTYRSFEHLHVFLLFVSINHRLTELINEYLLVSRTMFSKVSKCVKL